MKIILSFFGVAAIVCAIVLCGGWNQSSSQEDEYFRIHVVANSDSSYDQEVRYVVKDAVVEFLVSKFENVSSCNEAQTVVSQNLNDIERVIGAALAECGAGYSSEVSIKSEEMPMRAYGNLTLQQGVYPSLVITLGSGCGDNWWCVIFPSVCFIDTKNIQNYEYISKIWDIINGVTCS